MIIGNKIHFSRERIKNSIPLLQGFLMEKIIEVPIEEGLQTNYLNYAMSVIIGRYIPDVRDGLKPVHRRILYSMYEKGIRANQKTRKSAKVVGDVLGNYHPHGDLAVYDALVRLAQDFSMRYMMVDGQGNFGSVDGDPPAAMRYTECRMSKIAEELLTDIDKNTVDFIPNYDNTTEEPSVLPAGFPNLLVSGSIGIAVAMATKIPPHNLREVVAATQALIDNPDLSIDDLFHYIKGPDFPTGAGIFRMDGVRAAYRTGRGSFVIRGNTQIETLKSGKESIIITSIPYLVNKSELIKKIASLVKEDKIKGISEIRDESNKEGIRVVMELKKGSVPSIIINQLYLMTQLQTTWGIILLAIVGKKPVILNLKEILKLYIDFKLEVLLKRTRFDLDKAEARMHIVQGLLTAVDNLDEVVRIIRASQTSLEAKTNLMERFSLSELQAQAVLDLRLSKLVALEKLNLENEKSELEQKISYFNQLLVDTAEQNRVMKAELAEVSDKYGDDRRTEILKDVAEDITMEETIKNEECVVLVANTGLIKRTSRLSYRTQKRGGRGKTGANIREDEQVDHLITSYTHNYLLFFTDKGKVYYLKVWELPEGSAQSRGKSIRAFINIAEDEQIQSYLQVEDFKDDEYVFFITKKGIVKKTAVSDFINAKRRGINAISLDEDDELVNAIKTKGKQQIFIATRKGQGLRIDEEEIRPMGRSARGVIGIRLRGDNSVIGATLIQESTQLLAVTSRGYGKLVDFEEFTPHKRGTMGQRFYAVSEKTGDVSCIQNTAVSEDTQCIIATKSGIVMKTNVMEISQMGRNARGSILIKVHDKDDEVAAIAIIDNETDSEPEEKE